MALAFPIRFPDPLPIGNNCAPRLNLSPTRDLSGGAVVYEPAELRPNHSQRKIAMANIIYRLIVSKRTSVYVRRVGASSWGAPRRSNRACRRFVAILEHDSVH